MKKFWSFFSISISDALIYRATGFIWMLNDIGPAAVSLIFWLAAFQTKPLIGSYSASGMIIYYLGIMSNNNLVDTHPQYHLSDEIKSGVFSNYLTKPFSITVKKIADAISWRIVRIIFLAPIFLIFFLLFKSYWENYSLNFVNILSFMISLFFAFFLNFFIKMSLGLSSVWFLESGWLFFFYQILASFFSGELIPLDLFPSTFLKLVNLLPFKYMLFFPLSLMLNKITQLSHIGLGLLIQLIWCLVFYLIYKLVLKKGFKAYDVFGG